LWLSYGQDLIVLLKNYQQSYSTAKYSTSKVPSPALKIDEIQFFKNLVVFTRLKLQFVDNLYPVRKTPHL